jgi:hypothetical protein
VNVGRKEGKGLDKDRGIEYCTVLKKGVTVTYNNVCSSGQSNKERKQIPEDKHMV